MCPSARPACCRRKPAPLHHHALVISVAAAPALTPHAACRLVPCRALLLPHAKASPVTQLTSPKRTRSSATNATTASTAATIAAKQGCEAKQANIARASAGSIARFGGCHVAHKLPPHTPPNLCLRPTMLLHHTPHTTSLLCRVRSSTRLQHSSTAAQQKHSLRAHLIS